MNQVTPGVGLPVHSHTAAVSSPSSGLLLVNARSATTAGAAETEGKDILLYNHACIHVQKSMNGDVGMHYVKNRGNKEIPGADLGNCKGWFSGIIDCTHSVRKIFIATPTCGDHAPCR